MNENMMNGSYEVQVEGDSLGDATAKTFGWMFCRAFGYLYCCGGLCSPVMERFFIYIPLIDWHFSRQAGSSYVVTRPVVGVIFDISLRARIEDVRRYSQSLLFFLYTALNGICIQRISI